MRMLSQGAVARIIALELARTSGFVLLVTALAGLGLRWCMPSVFAALASRYVLPETPDWPPVLWLFLGVPWFVFAVFAVAVQAIDWGFWSWLAIMSSVCGFAIASIVFVVSTPRRMRQRMIETHGDGIIAAALVGLPVRGDEPSLVQSLQARLLELGLRSYVLRKIIVRTLLDTPPTERNPRAILERCMIPFRRRARRAWWIIGVALLSSLAAILTLRFAAHHLWPAQTPMVGAEAAAPTDG